jgi:hypothetical protein
MRTFVVVATVSFVVMSSVAWAADVAVTAAESKVHSAPFDVAPVLGNLHAGDKLTGEPDARAGWLRVTLPDGRQGFLHANDTQIVGPPPPPAVSAPAPVSVPPAEIPDGAAAAPAPGPSAPAPSPEPAPPAVTLTPAAPLPFGQTLLGVAFELFPVGTINGGNSVDADVTAALAPFLDVPLSPGVALGVSPQFLFKVKASGDTQSATEYDLRARLTLREPVAPNARVFARLSPGYSIVSLPSGALPAGASDPSGFVVDFSFGTEAMLWPDTTLVVDVGYQLGFQGTSVDGQEVDYRTRFLHVGFGLALGN